MSKADTRGPPGFPLRSMIRPFMAWPDGDDDDDNNDYYYDGDDDDDNDDYYMMEMMMMMTICPDG